MERESTIRKLFSDEKIQFLIPSYQRAYSWGAKAESERDRQVIQFIDDLKEQKKKYYFGHFLFEKHNESENRYQVIDGQQRLTSIVIFFSCLIKILEKRVKEGEILCDKEGDPLELWRLKERYIAVKRLRKFKTVDYNDNFFENLVVNHQTELTVNYASERRIEEAYNYLLKVLDGESTNEIVRWMELIEEATITTYEVGGKTLATQIFGFQNDRGKSLTNLESLKAFLMYKIYVHTSEHDANDAIQYVEQEFSLIYQLTEKMQLTEDQVLNFYSVGFMKGWNSPIENVKKELDAAEEKDVWIKSFCGNLRNCFVNVESIEKQSSGSNLVGDILVLDSHNSWPLLIKIFHFHGKEIASQTVQRVLKLIEITLFKLHYSFGDYRTNEFHRYAKEHSGDLSDLLGKLEKTAKGGFKWYWAFEDNFKRYIEGGHHYNNGTRYLLWKYENRLREIHKVAPMPTSEYRNVVGNRRLDNTLEHIAPQKPGDGPYNKEFESKYLNNVGNLLLMTLGKNASEGNKDPILKAAGFQNSTLISQKKVGDAILKVGKWDEDEITARQREIILFASAYWNPDS